MLAPPLVRPDDDRTPESVAGIAEHLKNSEIFREYQQAFEATTGLPLALRAASSFQPPLHGSARCNPFCRLMAAESKSCAACLQLQQRIADEALLEPATRECFAGLTESAAPIRVGESVPAFIQTGQVLLRPPSKVRFRALRAHLEAAGAQLDWKQAETAYFQTRVVAAGQYKSAVRMIGIFARHLSGISNQIVMRESAGEHPAVARARAFIADHHREKLPLATVAKAANMSSFYFSKIFRKEAGLSFREYLSRVRIDTAEQQMLNPHRRVSEAAFAAGFQSLSQFNRTFRYIVGESPTTYRNRLAGPRPSGALLPALGSVA